MARLGKRLFRIVILVLLPSTAAVAGAYLYLAEAHLAATDNAYVRADLIAIATEIDGRVARVLVEDHATVERGQLLFEIDPEPFELELAAAEAELSLVRQRVDALRAQIRESEIDIRAARERVRFLNIEYERQRDLADKGHGVRARLEAAEHELASAHQRIAALGQRRARLIAELGGAIDAPLEEHPWYRRASIARDKAALDLSRTRVLAPVDGTVGSVTLEPGEQIEAMEPLFPLVAGGMPWIEANLKETHLTHVLVGQRAKVVVDSYPDLVWHATVSSISPATGAEFAVLPAQNATGNWVKVVQRVPVRLHLDPIANAPILRAGMTATVEIDTDRPPDPLVAAIDRVLSRIGIGAAADER